MGRKKRREKERKEEKKRDKRKGKNIPITKLLSCHSQVSTSFTTVLCKAPQFRDVGTPFSANSLGG